MTDFLSDLPKPYAPRAYIDLHIHLDGAITPFIARRLAALQHQKLDCASDKELESLLTIPPGCRDLNEFLRRFDLPISLLQTSESISEAVFLVQEDLKRQGVVYAELRFAPQSFTQRGLNQSEVIEAALKGLERSDLCCNLILCCMRGPGRESANRETVMLARRYLVKHGGVTALDLAGAEALYATRDYRDLFAFAARLDVPYTLHAGEADGPESVRCAIEMGAKRIGHGVRAASDPELMEYIRKNGVTLEMCPTSNMQTHAIDNMSLYPLKQFLEKGIKATLNTDDPAISGTDIVREFAFAREKLGVTAALQQTLLANSAAAAFTDDNTRQWIYDKLG